MEIAGVAGFVGQRHRYKCQGRGFCDAVAGALVNKLIRRLGRPVSIPVEAYDEVFRLHAAGLGYRRIATRLESIGVYTTKSSVERLLKGQSPYFNI